MRGLVVGIGALLLLAACNPRPGQSPQSLLAEAEATLSDPKSYDLEAVKLETQRTYERAFQEQPFARGPMAVLATENGDLKTWRLVPCQGGHAICAGSEGGPVGRLGFTPDYYVIQGLYGRIFFLSWAGDGYLREPSGVYVPLAWNAMVNGTGPGTQAAMDTPVPHS